ncbi:AIPR family protein [Ochrobactrum pseudogrignonense]|nr:AIPR family protein [Brucella pseudogrignonensis]
MKVTQGRDPAIASISNLQIVNGGQTTASIHAASRKKEPGLDKVFVQMKLSIVEQSMASDVVPKISEFANSQNKVNAADFFANHAFHIRFRSSRGASSRRHRTDVQESKWFYERARGQYQDARNLLKTAQKRKFDVEFPKSQMIDKTDLAKFLNPGEAFPKSSAGARRRTSCILQTASARNGKRTRTRSTRIFPPLDSQGDYIP